MQHGSTGSGPPRADAAADQPRALRGVALPAAVAAMLAVAAGGALLTGGAWGALGLLLAAVGLAGLTLHRHHQRWRARLWERPLAELEAALSAVRGGAAPVDHLPAVDGPLQGLSIQIQQLLREIRGHKGELNRLEQEMRQRMTQRADAMERRLSALRSQANRDPLTGLYNRRMLEQHLPQLIDEASAAGGELAVAILDLDNYKQLNDTLGHAAGDEALRSVGQIIRSGIREEDLGFRYGGDEFVLVLIACPRRGAEGLIDRLTRLVDALGRTLRTPSPIGLSAGLCCLSEHPTASAAELLQQADRLLYANKQRRKASATAA